MKTKLFILAVAMMFASCATTSLSTKTAKYDVISAKARGFNRNNNATSYDAIIRIGKVYYAATLTESLGILRIEKVLEKVQPEANTLAN